MADTKAHFCLMKQWQKFGQNNRKKAAFYFKDGKTNIDPDSEKKWTAIIVFVFELSSVVTQEKLLFYIACEILKMLWIWVP